MRYCESCGAPQPTPCPNCGADPSPDARFCGACGTRLELIPTPVEPDDADAETHTHADERKHLSALFCDIVNSTGLAEQIGAEAMHELLDRFVAIGVQEVERFGGAVSKFLGDGLLALVGVPVSREDHAERALLIALALRDRLSKEVLPLSGGERFLSVRIGINSGPVVVGTLGGERAADYSATGDTINVAARLESLAAPNEILIGDATARLLGGRASLEALGPVVIRGRNETLQAYRVISDDLGPRIAPAAEMTGPFVGRQRQLSLLRELFEEVRAGEGQVASIVAEPGMGKSRLLQELRRELLRRGVSCSNGRCRSYGKAIPYLPLLEVVREVAGFGSGASSEEVAQANSRALAALGPDPDERAPFLNHLFGVPGSTEAFRGLSTSAVKGRTFETLRLLLLPPATSPAVVMIEDVQWIDRTSEEFLAVLADRIVNQPLLLITTQRPGQRPPWMELSYATQIALPGLRPGAARTVVRAATGDDVPAENLDAIVRRAGGNPLFLEELARDLSESGHREGTVLPDSVQGVIGARIDRLSADARSLLRVASVLGREFPTGLLKALRPENDLTVSLDELAHHELLVERGGSGEACLTFRHALAQEVAYDSLLIAQRKTLHASAAAALEHLHRENTDEVLDQLAYHFSRSGLPERAVEHLARFADAAASRHAHAEAARVLEEALVHADAMPEDRRNAAVADLTLALVSSLYFLGRLKRCRALLLDQERRVEKLGDVRLSARHRFWLAHTLSHLGHTQEADREARRAIAEGERAGDAVVAGRGHYVLAREGVWRGRYSSGVDHGRRAVAILEGAGDRWWLAYAICWLATNHGFRGEFLEALDGANRALEIGRELGDVRAQAYAANHSAWFHAMRGEGRLATDLARQALGLASDPLLHALATAILGLGLRECGDHEAAIKALDESISDMDRFGYRRLVCWYTAWRGEARLGAGDLDGAAGDARGALAASRSLDTPWGAAVCERTLGRAAIASGRVPAGADHLRRAAASFERIGARIEAALTRADLVEVALATDGRDASVELRDARALLDGVDAPVHVGRLDTLVERAASVEGA